MQIWSVNAEGEDGDMATVRGGGVAQAPPRGERIHAILDLLRVITAERPELLAGPVASLHTLDATGRSDYIRSLRALFDHAGDVPEAAKALSLHPNTLRYRLRRMRELTGLNLADPIERLVAELQLRILFPGAGATV
jgi:DNA-binding PucR family transcriptional regulator